MSVSFQKSRNPEETRRKLIESTLRLMLQQGYAATTVDQICAVAGVTKGSFFHHFGSKEDIGRAALDFFAQFGTDLYSAAWKDPHTDPLEQLHRLFGIMIGFTRRPEEPCVCMVGMMSQEMSQTHPEIREACAQHLANWTAMVELMLTDAKNLHPPAVDFHPSEVAWFLNSLWQGSMLIGKARQNPQMIATNLQLARAYVDSLFGLSPADA